MSVFLIFFITAEVSERQVVKFYETSETFYKSTNCDISEDLKF